MPAEENKGRSQLIEASFTNGLWVTPLLAGAGWAIREYANYYPTFWHTAAWTALMFWLTAFATLFYPKGSGGFSKKAVEWQSKDPHPWKAQSEDERYKKLGAISCVLLHTILFFMYTVPLTLEARGLKGEAWANFAYGPMDWSGDWSSVLQAYACPAMTGYMVGQLLFHRSSFLGALIGCGLFGAAPFLSGFKFAVHSALVLEAGSYALCIIDLAPNTKMFHFLYLLVMPVSNFYSLWAGFYYYYMNFTNSTSMEPFYPPFVATFPPLILLLLWRTYCMLNPGDEYNVWKSLAIIRSDQ